MYLLVLFNAGVYTHQKGIFLVSTGISAIPIHRRHMVVNIVAREQGYKDMSWACHGLVVRQRHASRFYHHTVGKTKKSIFAHHTCTEHDHLYSMKSNGHRRLILGRHNV